jgi:hypothetical protein
MGVKYKEIKGSCTWIIVLWVVYIEDTCSELWSRFVSCDVEGTFHTPTQRGGLNLKLICCSHFTFVPRSDRRDRLQTSVLPYLFIPHIMIIMSAFRALYWKLAF